MSRPIVVKSLGKVHDAHGMIQREINWFVQRLRLNCPFCIVSTEAKFIFFMNLFSLFKVETVHRKTVWSNINLVPVDKCWALFLDIFPIAANFVSWSLNDTQLASEISYHTWRMSPYYSLHCCVPHNCPRPCCSTNGIQLIRGDQSLSSEARYVSLMNTRNTFVMGINA